MPKYIVALVETACLNVPVEAANAEEAEKKARHLVATQDLGADYVSVELNKYADDGEPVIEVDDETFSRFIPREVA